MKTNRGTARMIKLFCRLVFEMLKNYPRLNSDVNHNFQICKSICKKVVRSANIQLHIKGKVTIPKEENFLLVSNHRCFFDVIFLIASLEQTIRFAAAKELWKYPILRKYLDALCCVPIDRFSKKMSTLQQSIMNMKKTLQNGNLVLFPEGECTYYDYHIRKFKKGGFLCLPSRSQYIVPAYLQIEHLSNIGRWMIPQGDVFVYIGEGFCPEDVFEKRRSVGELAAYAQQCVLELQEKAKKESQS